MDSFGFGKLPDLRPIPIRNYQLEELARLNGQIEQAAAANSAGAFVRHIAAQVQAFEKALDQASEVGAYLVAFGQSLLIHVRSIRAIEPSLVVIEGTTGQDDPVKLVQHTSQLNFLLVKAERLDPDEPRRPIGFTVEEAAAK
jgi:hypothetical protein